MNRRGCFAILSALALAIGVESPRTAQACRCVEPSAARAYAPADVVILGSVQSVTTHGDLSVAVFSVDEAWKQDVAGRIEITFGGPCPFPLERSGRYLIYATRGPDGSLGTRRCRGDAPLAAAREKIAWLRKRGKTSAVRR